MPTSPLDATVLTAVLAGLRYPARPWQVMAEADSYGITAELRTALSQLPTRNYPDLNRVLETLDALGLVISPTSDPWPRWDTR